MADPTVPNLTSGEAAEAGNDQLTLAALGYSLGRWTDDVRHADPCDCDEDNETVGDRCMANSEWFHALLRDEGAHGWSLAYRLSEVRQ